MLSMLRGLCMGECKECYKDISLAKFHLLKAQLSVWHQHNAIRKQAIIIQLINSE